ncbi:MAG: glycoside hydrolase family 113 [Candidatus Polarisedimenticolia bacterium]
MSVLLCPQLYHIAGPDHGTVDLIDELSMPADSDWALWFDDYRRYIVQIARQAQDEKVELLCVGSELPMLSRFEDQWRLTIRVVREVFTGKLTYAAKWEEFERIGFWDALDYIGIQAYFPLSRWDMPTLDEMVEAWEGPMAAIARVSRTTGRKVVFTEIGYPFNVRGPQKPGAWYWHTPDDPEGGARVQAEAYEAFFRTAWRADWLAGAFIWNWYPGLGERRVITTTQAFTPQGKPALEVMKRWFLAEEAAAQARK